MPASEVVPCSTWGPPSCARPSEGRQGSPRSRPPSRPLARR